MQVVRAGNCIWVEMATPRHRCRGIKAHACDVQPPVSGGLCPDPRHIYSQDLGFPTSVPDLQDPLIQWVGTQFLTHFQKPILIHVFLSPDESLTMFTKHNIETPGLLFDTSHVTKLLIVISIYKFFIICRFFDSEVSILFTSLPGKTDYVGTKIVHQQQAKTVLDLLKFFPVHFTGSSKYLQQADGYTGVGVH